VDLAGLPLASLADLPGLVVRARGAEGRGVPLAAFQGLPVAGKAVLVETGWSRHWGNESYFEGSPFLARDAAAWLAAERAALVGLDAYNVDDTSGKDRPVHTALLGAGIPVVEHMTGLDALPDRGFRFFAVPAPVAGMGTFPVRAFAILDAPAA
jgi:kynurenine formamidase